MEFFRDVNIAWLGKKWYFLGFSLIFSVAGLVSMGMRWQKAGHPLPLGVDFSGGTLVYVKFTERPNEDNIRAAMDKVGLRNARIQRYDKPENNQLLIALELKETSEKELDRGKNQIIQALEPEAGSAQAQAGKQDLNNSSVLTVENYLLQKDPLRLGTDAQQRYGAMARSIVDFRDKDPANSGVLRSLDQLRPLADARVVAALREGFTLSNFAVRNVEIVGPQVGKQLQKQAALATAYASLGMLVYLAFRFELIYGVAAVVAVIHDTLITLGAFSLLGKEISLTVVAAILTLIGYSMNDTIVVFDRIRENLKLMRREPLDAIVNRSINQTLSRTILTSGLTFLTVMSLFLFGGEVLHGFSFALVIGILIGTYSSIAIAAPMLVAYQEWRASQGRRTLAPVSAEGRKPKAGAKV